MEYLTKILLLCINFILFGKNSTFAFNFGMQGQSLLFQYPLIKTILQRHNPKLVIITIDDYAINYFKTDRERLSFYLPFSGLNKYIDSAIISIDKYELLKSYSALYKYNSVIGYMMLNKRSKNYDKNHNSKGYEPRIGDICATSKDFEDANKIIPLGETDADVDKTKLNYLINIIDELNSRHIATIFITTPQFKILNKNERICLNRIQKVLKQKGVNFWDLSDDINFVNKCNLFYDPFHLNNQASEIFTNYIIEKLKYEIQIQ